MSELIELAPYAVFDEETGGLKVVKAVQWQKGSELPESVQEVEVDSPQIVLPGGAVRSERAPRWNLLTCLHGLRRLVSRFSLGADKYGEDNWRRSLSTEQDAALFCAEAYNHMVEHQMKLGAGIDPEDDHLAAIAWATMAIMEAEGIYGKRWQELSAEPPAEAETETA